MSKGRRGSKGLIDEFAAVLSYVPVYPNEISLHEVGRHTNTSGRKLKLWLSYLAVDFPLAERTEGRSLILCWPTLDDKRSALGRFCKE